MNSGEGCPCPAAVAAKFSCAFTRSDRCALHWDRQLFARKWWVMVTKPNFEFRIKHVYNNRFLIPHKAYYTWIVNLTFYLYVSLFSCLLLQGANPIGVKQRQVWRFPGLVSYVKKHVSILVLPNEKRDRLNVLLASHGYTKSARRWALSSTMHLLIRHLSFTALVAFWTMEDSVIEDASKG